MSTSPRAGEPDLTSQASVHDNKASARAPGQVLWDWFPWESVSELLESLHERHLSLFPVRAKGPHLLTPFPPQASQLPLWAAPKAARFLAGSVPCWVLRSPSGGAASWMHLFSRSESPPDAHKHPRSPGRSLLAPPGPLSAAQSARTVAAGCGSPLRETRAAAALGAGLPPRLKPSPAASQDPTLALPSS